MNLDDLLAAMEAAQAKALAEPENKELQTAAEQAETAYNEAKAAADAAAIEDPEDFDESKADEKTKKYLAKLRKENAGHRTKAKDLASKVKAVEDRNKAILKAAGIEVEEEKPEEKVKVLSEEKLNLAFRNAILESAVQHGISGEGLDYYEFLISKATSELEEGDELDDEALKAIVLKVKKQGKGPANSTVTGGQDGKGGGSAPAPGGSGQMTLEKFCSLSIAEKSILFQKNPDEYANFMSQARAKKKLV